MLCEGARRALIACSTKVSLNWRRHDYCPQQVMQAQGCSATLPGINITTGLTIPESQTVSSSVVSIVVVV